jgi:hypothetical protein
VGQLELASLTSFNQRLRFLLFLHQSGRGQKPLRDADSISDDDVVEKAIFSAHSIARNSKDANERAEIISLMAQLVKTHKSYRVRYRAYRALQGDAASDSLSITASKQEQEKIKGILRGYDPEPDKAAFLGRKKPERK